MKKILIGGIIGGIIGFVLNLLIGLDIDLFNKFYTPLFELTNLTYIVPLTFAIVGLVIGCIIGLLLEKKKTGGI